MDEKRPNKKKIEYYCKYPNDWSKYSSEISFCNMWIQQEKKQRIN